MIIHLRRARLYGAPLLAIFMIVGATVNAHEIGTTRVSALLQHGRYEIEVVTDAPSLVDKLNGAPMSIEMTATELADRLVAGDERFRRRVTVAFDGVTADPERISYSVQPAANALSPILATIRLSGASPKGAKAFTWSFGWTFASYALTAKNDPAADATDEWLEGGQTSRPFSLSAPRPLVTRLSVAERYLTLGFTHIVPYGLDHMLFVIGIFLLSGRVRTVLWQVSAFTIAHSITLGMSIYGLIAVPPAIVEPLIAISIVYVAVENLLLSELKPWRVALVFGFGLLHGMGFAGALSELGLPRQEFVTALVTFNLGVEAGQLAVIAVAFALVGWQWNSRDWYRRRIVVPASLAIACTAVYWTVERLTF
jgi:hydrogenase/urease accessory protein HupE